MRHILTLASVPLLMLMYLATVACVWIFLVPQEIWYNLKTKLKRTKHG